MGSERSLQGSGRSLSQSERPLRVWRGGHTYKWTQSLHVCLQDIVPFGAAAQNEEEEEEREVNERRQYMIVIEMLFSLRYIPNHLFK